MTSPREIRCAVGEFLTAVGMVLWPFFTVVVGVMGGPLIVASLEDRRELSLFQTAGIFILVSTAAMVSATGWAFTLSILYPGWVA